MTTSKKLLTSLITCVFFLVALGNLSGQCDPEKEKVVHELLQLYDLDSFYGENLIEMIGRFKYAELPQIPDSFWEPKSLGPLFERVNREIDSLHRASICEGFDIETLEYLTNEQAVVVEEVLLKLLNDQLAWHRNRISEELMKKVEAEGYIPSVENPADCQLCHAGTFFTLFPDGQTVRIERTANRHVETYGENVLKFDLEWLSPCRYRITLTETNDPLFMEDMLGNDKGLVVEIVDLREDHYLCRVVQRGTKSDLMVFAKVYFERR
jgi:hypothetical protein